MRWISFASQPILRLHGQPPRYSAIHRRNALTFRTSLTPPPALGGTGLRSLLLVCYGRKEALVGQGPQRPREWKLRANRIV